ncbi:MAG: hypothetical protein EOO09_02520 [Chitinophagaceae bacterium]|nr:MAG: hypothetical protein EOO09_02520 [Chitinophagaceae bacterium]
MQFAFRSILAALLVFTLWSCKKEEVQLTQAQLSERQLQEVLSQNGIRRVYPVKYGEALPTPFPSAGGMTYKFSNGFLTVDYGFPGSYNLDYLMGYQIANVPLTDGSAQVALILYME